MARDQRTRLNAELAHQYSRKRGGPAVAPGRNSLTGELEEKEEGEGEVEGDVEEQEARAPEEQLAASEPKKSLFELPRKEPSRQPLPTSVASVASKPGAPPAAAAPPAAPKSRDPRRG